MPGEFLTAAQERAYGHFVGPPSNQQLSRYFHLDDADRELVNVRRGAHNKLGFALQLTTVRFLGTFLTEPTTVPPNVVAYVAAQLGIGDVACLADYAARPTTAREHAAEILRVYGYRDFSHPSASFRLVRWLYHGLGSAQSRRACCLTWRLPGWSSVKCCCRACRSWRGW